MLSINSNHSNAHYQGMPGHYTFIPANSSTQTTFDRGRTKEEKEKELIKNWIEAYNKTQQFYVNKEELDSSKATNIYFNPKPEHALSKVIIDLLRIEKNGSNIDQKTDIFIGILETVLETDTDYPISLRSALNALLLASELITISSDMDYYASPDDSITFELFLDNKRATIEQTDKISLVISNDSSAKIKKFPATSEGLNLLKEYIVAF